MAEFSIPLLPLDIDIETKAVLKKVTQANKALAELKGAANSIPNEAILINTLSLQEAKDSSAIENIITTNDELYQSDSFSEEFASAAAKEVHNYARALRSGFLEVKRTGLLTNNLVLRIQEQIEANNAGFRKVLGTSLKNKQTGEVIYTPPQHYDDIVRLMTNLEQFINTNELCDWDPLVKMAIIHHQFETIHPFYDGNGRTGRIVNILYLVKEGLLNIPVLYLSRFINVNKATYYRLIRDVQATGNWEEWVLFMLDGIEQTSQQTIILIDGIKKLMHEYKSTMREQLPKIYSQDLLNNLFRHPYTKIDFVVKELGVSRITATRYLDELVRIGLVRKHKIKTANYYINHALYNLLGNTTFKKV